MLKRIFLATAVISAPAFADPPVINAVVAEKSGGEWRFDVTLSHGDTGWDHYADRFEVLAPDGTVLGVRELLHPHVEEQPFTRTLNGVVIEPSIDTVTVRAHDNVHGYGGKAIEVELQP